MSKSYKSALPTWTTYTPYMSPVSTQPAINQENWWRNRAHQYAQVGTSGTFNKIALGAMDMAKGTGSGYAAAGILGHRPISTELESRGGRSGQPSAEWYRKMQEAVKHGTPETMVAPGEEEPQSEMQVRAARTAAATVNPADVQTQQAARQTSDVLGRSAVASKKTGTSSVASGVIGTFPDVRSSRGGRPNITIGG